MNWYIRTCICDILWCIINHTVVSWYSSSADKQLFSHYKHAQGRTACWLVCKGKWERRIPLTPTWTGIKTVLLNSFVTFKLTFVVLCSKNPFEVSQFKLNRIRSQNNKHLINLLLWTCSSAPICCKIQQLLSMCALHTSLWFCIAMLLNPSVLRKINIDLKKIEAGIPIKCYRGWLIIILFFHCS